VWFAQFESQFALSNNTQDATKFYYVISQLDNKYATELEDVIINPHQHDRINAELIRCLSLSQEQHVRQLLMREEMGDWRVTQFLRHLRTPADPSVLSDFLGNLRTNPLPPNIQAIIATHAQVALEDAAQLANKIVEVSPPPCVAGVSSSGDEISTFTAHIGELARQVFALSGSLSRPRSP
jgi:hypothetical protein